jgi:hypothetical protein
MFRVIVPVLIAVLLVVARPVSAQSLGIAATQSAAAFRKDTGKRLTFVCHGSDGKNAAVHGTDVYTDDSAICAAAIHAGVLKTGQAGVVTIQMGSGAKEFRGSARNGITSRNYGRWESSFTFARDAALGSITWTTTWGQMPKDFDEPVTVACGAGGKVDAPVWGTDVYTSDSAICVAAVHAGVFAADKGGVVVAKRAPGLKEYPGTQRRGITSRKWGTVPDAFSVAAATSAPTPLTAPVPTSVRTLPTPLLTSSSSGATAECALAIAVTEGFASMRARVSTEYATLRTAADATTGFNAAALTSQRDALLLDLRELETQNFTDANAACEALLVTQAPPPPAQGRPISRGTVVAEPSGELSSTQKAGPPPADFRVTGYPGVAELRWTRAESAQSYRLFRSDAAVPTSVETPLQVLWNSGAREVRDTVPDVRVTYRYRLAVEYQDGTVGEGVVSWLSPPPTNPTGFRAQLSGPNVVTLAWDRALGAVEYRIDGTGLPNTGMTVADTTATVSLSGDRGSWQLVALYPGAADYENRPTATVAPAAIPSHAPAFLSKSAGPGNGAEAAAHYERLCNWTADSPVGCDNLADYLDSWGVATSVYFGFGNEDPFVRYNNVTDLGVPRETRCISGKPTPTDGPSQKRKYFGPGPVICYSNSGATISLIVMYSEGALFGVFQRTGGADDFGYDDSWPNATPLPATTFDSEGPKFTPHACLACHGGTYDPVSKLVKNASLLPIDPSLVQVVGDGPDAQEKIRVINALVRQTYSSPAVAAYVEGLYGGVVNGRRMVDVPGTPAIPSYVPQGWATQRSLYLDFVKKDCAMCHLAGQANLNFLTAGNLLANKTLVHAAVCSARSMPHAEVAFKRFWTSGSGTVSGPGWFAAALGFESC